MYELSQFDNGLRLVTVSMPHAYSISMGLYLKVGARYESDAEAGASHFIEHLLFKGTERRPTPREIALAIEGVGGSINASTGRETTNYYVRVSRDDFRLAADVLVDMLCNSHFLPTDIEREAQVIVEEINESLDMPDDVAFMEAQQMLFPNHPLGRDIAGSRETVRGLTREALLDYMERGYTPDNTVVAVAGAITHAEARDVIGASLGGWQGGSQIAATTAPSKIEQRAKAIYRPVEQSHIVLATRGYDRFHPDRFALSLLNGLLGEGMSSRLFIAIREELGLAYSVYSYTSSLQDVGTFAVYAAVDGTQVKETVRAILEQLHRLRDAPVSAEELAFAKAYVRGSLLLSLEHSGANAGWVGNRLVTTGHIATPEEVVSSFNAVTSEDIQRVACALFRDDTLLLSVVGPVEEEQEWESLLKVE